MTNQQTVDFDGPIGPSMSEFSSEYMTYVESHLDEDLTHVADRILALLRSMQSLTQGFAIAGFIPTLGGSPGHRLVGLRVAAMGGGW